MTAEAGLYRCDENEDHPHGNELLVYVMLTEPPWCHGKRTTFVRKLNAAEKRELAADERRSRATMSKSAPAAGTRSSRTPQPTAEDVTRALELFANGAKRKAVAEATGLTDYQVWRLQRDYGLL